MKKLFNHLVRLNNEKGVTLVYVAILIVVFLGIAALAIDIGYHRVVRNQLQNAADAAALAACNRFYSRNPVTFPPPPPNWAAASTEAAEAITINTADNKQLISGSIATGWWDITQSAPGSLWPNPTVNPPPNLPPNQNYGPAINVAIRKTAGENEGPVSNFFGSVFGVLTTDIGANATAVAASPGTVRSGAVVPVAISRQVANQYYNTYNSPSNLIIIGSPYMYPNQLAGQWTSFNLDTNNVPDVQGLISGGNPTALSVGDYIWIQPGVKDVLYDNKNQPSIENTFAGQNIVFPIVDATLNDSTHSEAPISGFIGFHIVCAGKGCKGQTITLPDESKVTIGANEKVIIGYFTTAPSYGSGPIGAHYGPLDRCRLCQ